MPGECPATLRPAATLPQAQRTRGAGPENSHRGVLGALRRGPGPALSSPSPPRLGAPLQHLPPPSGPSTTDACGVSCQVPPGGGLCSGAVSYVVNEYTSLRSSWQNE